MRVKGNMCLCKIGEEVGEVVVVGVRVVGACGAFDEAVG